jgi:hypothetical protein
LTVGKPAWEDVAHCDSAILCGEPSQIMSGKIDDPIEASIEAFPKEPGGLGGKFSGLALSFGSLVFKPAAILKILTYQFQPTKRFERIEYLLNGLRIGAF